MLHNFTITASLIILLVAAGCARALPVHNVQGAPVISNSAKTLTLDQVRTAIIGAAQSKRWRVQQIEDGHMVATIQVRKHSAAVDIRYTETDYSITYKNSSNLQYTGQTIHRNYNKWIKLLDRRIAQELNTL